jgi:DNA-binding MarR family transcriptional regulator
MQPDFHFARAPGHLIRRAHQLSVATFTRALADWDVTPVQFAVLSALVESPGVDQITLAARVAFDPATSGSVIARLEQRGLLHRESDPRDKRRKLLWATPSGAKLVRGTREPVARVQDTILEPLDPAERTQLMALLDKLVSGLQAKGG